MTMRFYLDNSDGHYQPGHVYQLSWTRKKYLCTYLCEWEQQAEFRALTWEERLKDLVGRMPTGQVKSAG